MTSGEALNNELKVAIPSEHFYKQPSSNENISYILFSLINHDGDSLDCGYYVSDVFDSSTGIWWQCGDDNITQISDEQKGVYYRKTHKHIKNKNKMMTGSADVLFLVYIITSHMTKHRSNFFQEFTTMSKITHMKKVIKDQYFFRSDFKVIQEVNDGIQKLFIILKMSLKISLKIIFWVKQKRKIILVAW